ncbi:MAG TPA: acetyl-CoA C-acyltransferase, partial [Candidatus Limnocylindria bacterium]|nr:acetyl-CoA C-acyltransferase [Candidatus Limnocylindria bacterium]
MREAVVVASSRTPLAKSHRGSFNITRPDDLAAHCIKDVLGKAPQLDIAEIEDVILGCAQPNGPQGSNVARVALIRAGLPVSVAGTTVNRFCSSGLQAIAMAAQSIATGQAEVVVAGGTESMSLIPMGGHRITPNPGLLDRYPDSYLGMGITAEILARKHGITREKADAFSLESHRRAVSAIDGGRFKDEIVPLKVGGATFDTDEGPRRDSTAEALAKLKPAFSSDGIVTAGNSSQMSDGAAAAVLMSGERAKELGLQPLGRFVAFAVAGVPPELMGIGPVEAVPRVLKQAGLTLADIDLIELNEAFAAQALAVIEALGL